MNKESIAEELRERNMNVNMAEDSYQLAQWHIDKQIELLKSMKVCVAILDASDYAVLQVDVYNLIDAKIKELKDAN